MTGWQTLLYKEVLRFWKVAFQTVAAPVLTSVLYMLIFGHVLEDHVKVYDNVPYTSFLLPGLMMMGVLQNAFANSSSSLVQSKIMGSLVFLLLTPLSHRSWFVAYVGAAMMGSLGVIAGLWAEKFDQMAAFQNFIIMPMTFLSGVFYSIHSLPPFWQKLSHLNPFFYMIDGFRYGFFGQSDVSPWLSLAVVGTALAAISGLTLHLLRIGYKIRS
jgi:ABC-2 type transport system permease protein